MFLEIRMVRDLWYGFFYTQEQRNKRLNRMFFKSLKTCGHNKIPAARNNDH